MLELIVNALRFSPPGSIVKIVGVKHRDQYMFDVLNEGASLPKNFELLSGDFMQFNRNEMEQQGLGLGLPLAIGLLERNASWLSWVRIDGQPNTVRVCVPCLS
jgi:two-component system sensor kinase